MENVNLSMEFVQFIASGASLIYNTGEVLYSFASENLDKTAVVSIIDVTSKFIPASFVKEIAVQIFASEAFSQLSAEHYIFLGAGTFLASYLAIKVVKSAVVGVFDFFTSGLIKSVFAGMTGTAATIWALSPKLDLAPCLTSSLDNSSVTSTLMQLPCIGSAVLQSDYAQFLGMLALSCTTVSLLRKARQSYLCLGTGAICAVSLGLAIANRDPATALAPAMTAGQSLATIAMTAIANTFIHEQLGKIGIARITLGSLLAASAYTSLAT